MILSDFIAINYKSCRHLEIVIRDNSPTILIGENDCGKTTLLKAINYLLDSEPKKDIYWSTDKTDRQDLSHSPMKVEEINSIFNAKGLPNLLHHHKADSKYVVFAGKVKLDDCDNVFDDLISYQLRWAIESSILNNSNNFWLIRVFSLGCEPETYYLSEHPKDAGLKDIYAYSTESKAKSLREKYDPSKKNLVNDNDSGKYTIYENLRAVLKSVETEKTYIAISNKQWKSDVNVFPEYVYLDWKGSLDTVTETTERMVKDIIQQEVKEAQNAANNLKEAAQDKIDSQLALFGIQEEVSIIEKIIANINFDVKANLSELLVKKVGIENSIHIEDQGEGIKRQIWFALIKYQSQQKFSVDVKKRYLWCFDEPETHLHPKAQRDFFQTLVNLANKNFQILISTHSTIFVDASHLDNIYNFSKNNGYTNISNTLHVQDIFYSLGVKNSDFLFYNKFLMVEGATELQLIPKLYKLYTKKTLYQDHIQIINLNGCKNVRHTDYVFSSLLSGFVKPDDITVYILDSDTKLDKHGENKFFVGKQDLEDAIPAQVWIKLTKTIFNGLVDVTQEEVFNIVNSVENKNQKKFAPLFKKLMHTKLSATGLVNPEDEILKLPSKSEAWGKLIADHIESVEDIPLPIIHAFDALRSYNY
ncbi:MAG: AAA family ATPase [Thiofilum sp.]|uniref:AAA family ATPase n=1 Tax=Thiofilum sp. TaxID=2212733 RepID=UPI0025D81E38|nr:AAA family ATPase [Thiofilum sp.]MBK8451845.1 AAA family ATPase [Thiofilum sp.]